MVLYIGAEEPLPLLAWDESSPAFHVQDLDSQVLAVRRQLAVPHVYYAGSHQGCGCGFQLGEYPDPNDEEAPANRESLRQLADYVEAQIAVGNRLQFFACWSGDEAAVAEHRRVVKVGDLRSDAFYFLEKEASCFVVA